MSVTLGLRVKLSSICQLLIVCRHVTKSTCWTFLKRSKNIQLTLKSVSLWSSIGGWTDFIFDATSWRGHELGSFFVQFAWNKRHKEEREDRYLLSIIHMLPEILVIPLKLLHLLENLRISLFGHILSSFHLLIFAVLIRYHLISSSINFFTFTFLLLWLWLFRIASLLFVLTFIQGLPSLFKHFTSASIFSNAFIPDTFILFIANVGFSFHLSVRFIISKWSRDS